MTAGAGERARELAAQVVEDFYQAWPSDWRKVIEERLAGALAAVRLEEARWWHKNLIDPWAFDDSEVGRGAIKRLAELERAAAGERAVEGK